MQIFIDADACPNPIKNILFRAAERAQVPLTLVANRFIKAPPSSLIKTIVVTEGPDVADNKIVEMVQQGDLVITADIPLANNVVEKGGYALSPRGEMYTEENIRQALSIRDFMTDLRDEGVNTGGPSAFHQRDCNAFANQLDRFLAQH